jgi:hypothetical protein
VTSNNAHIERLTKFIDELPKYSTHPIYSVFGVTAMGNYTTLYCGQYSHEAAKHYINCCWNKKFVGVEFRLNGVRTNVSEYNYARN